MNTREILTLQFGHYSNYVGTHWWNLQETGFEYSEDPIENDNIINNDVLYRQGENAQGQVTYTPRLLLVDLKGSLKTLPEDGDLYEPLPDKSNLNTSWDENLLQVTEQEKTQKNEFLQDLSDNQQCSSNTNNKCYNLEEDVQVWSDFLYSRFHPRTVNVIKDYEHNNIHTPFDAFPLGTNLWKTSSFEDDFTDKIRNYTEECDSLQGFHVLLDGINSFSGLSTSCIQHLRDDYDRKSVLAFPVIPSFYEDYNYKTEAEKDQMFINDSVRVLNLAFTFDSLAEHSSLFVPLCAGSKGWRQPGPKREFYHTIYNHKSAYHSSAILASALDTFTLKHRLKNSQYSLSDLCVDLTPYGRKIAAASLCLPFSLNRDTQLIECLDKWEGPLSRSITPNCEITTEYMMQLFTLRGINEKRMKLPANKAGKQLDMPAYKSNNIQEMLSMYLAYTTNGCANNITVVEKPISVKTPFPRIFDNKVGVDGNIYGDSRPDNIGVENVPVLAGLHSGSSISGMIESLHKEAKKIKIRHFHQFTTAGIEEDDFTECLDKFLDLKECYEDSYFL